MPTLEDIDRSEKFLKALREAVGTEADLLFGTHGQFSISGAKRMARMMEAMIRYGFEEPTPPERPEMMAQVAAATNIPVATGERLIGQNTNLHAFLKQVRLIHSKLTLDALAGFWRPRKLRQWQRVFMQYTKFTFYCGPIVEPMNIQLRNLTKFLDTGVWNNVRLPC